LKGWKGGSAFECFIEFLLPNSKKGFLGIEYKYAENLKEQRRTAFERNSRYREVS
jgi:hypothetical protein